MYPSKAEMGMIDKGPCFSNGGSSERWELDEAETVKNDTVSPPFHPANVWYSHKWDIATMIRLQCGNVKQKSVIRHTNLEVEG